MEKSTWPRDLFRVRLNYFAIFKKKTHTQSNLSAPKQVMWLCWFFCSSSALRRWRLLLDSEMEWRTRDADVLSPQCVFLYILSFLLNFITGKLILQSTTTSNHRRSSSNSSNSSNHCRGSSSRNHRNHHTSSSHASSSNSNSSSRKGWSSSRGSRCEMSRAPGFLFFLFFLLRRATWRQSPTATPTTTGHQTVLHSVAEALSWYFSILVNKIGKIMKIFG